MTTGSQLFEQGTIRVIANNKDWTEQFNASAIQFISNLNGFTTDDIVQLIGRPPEHPNAIGAAAVKFARKHDLEVIGYKKTSQDSRRTARIAIWGKKRNNLRSI